MEFVLSEDSCIAGQWFESPTETAVAASRMVAQAVADAKQNPWPPFVTDAGPTTAERVERAFDALEQLYTESYAACGNRNPTWDNAAVNRLRQAANWVAHHSTDRVATKALLTEFGKLEKLDCTDPLIVYWQGNLRFHVNGAADATPYLRRALAGFDESNYPRMMLFYATRRLAAALAAQRGFEDPEVQHLRKRMFTHIRPGRPGTRPVSLGIPAPHTTAPETTRNDRYGGSSCRPGRPGPMGRRTGTAHAPLRDGLARTRSRMG
jgi:hypothetical protein